MSSKKSENSWTKDSLREALLEYLEKKTPVQADLARAIGASAQNITDWKESGAIAGWALINLISTHPDAKNYFLLRKPLIVAEESEHWESPRKRALFDLMKKLLREADDDLLSALLTLLRKLDKS
ncbi:MAG: hypothetical protein HYW03_17365 [Deltaproteobacteria bacterium]|nr:hypothetical protein [Deltaproteobacteria bacterium]